MNATRKTRNGIGILAASVAALTLVAGAAAASPTATTHGSTSLSNTSAKLTGTVNPHGQATNYYFEFGPTTAYGTRTTATSAGAGNRDVNVSATISGLQVSAIYHYRLVASNAAGTSLGADLSFQTTGPPAAETGGPQSVGTTTTTLTGSVDARGRATTWYFDYGTTTAYGSRTPNQNAGSATGPVPVTASVSGLSPATGYHYRLVAENASGTFAGTDMTFSTQAAVTIAQTAQRVVAGRYVALTGTVPGASSGMQVAILGQQFGTSGYTQVGLALTGSNGAWSFNARPLIQTNYAANANGGTTGAVTIGVQPSVLLRRLAGGRFSAHVSAATSFAGKQVKFQRLANGKWVNVKVARLSAGSTATFPASLLPHGKSTVRVALSVNQAGPGYLGGLSRTLTYTRA
jgi:hypothetical protein